MSAPLRVASDTALSIIGSGPRPHRTGSVVQLSSGINVDGETEGGLALAIRDVDAKREVPSRGRYPRNSARFIQSQPRGQVARYQFPGLRAAHDWAVSRQHLVIKLANLAGRQRARVVAQSKVYVDLRHHLHRHSIQQSGLV